jgi:hypothetical protein
MIFIVSLDKYFFAPSCFNPTQRGRTWCVCVCVCVHSSNAAWPHFFFLCSLAWRFRTRTAICMRSARGSFISTSIYNTTSSRRYIYKYTYTRCSSHTHTHTHTHKHTRTHTQIHTHTHTHTSLMYILVSLHLESTRHLRAGIYIYIYVMCVCVCVCVCIYICTYTPCSIIYILLYVY